MAWTMNDNRRLSEQVDNAIRSTSAPYWDTDDDDDGPNPLELYGRFTWKIANFSRASQGELMSEIFNIGGYKWHILIYPQGCEVQGHLSLFLCVANRDKLLPGWGLYAQFTIAVVNKDPNMSKFYDTFHRFCKKNHDWGWKKFMELYRLHEGFIVADTLEIMVQVQTIREKANRPFRCLGRQYRRELARIYFTNVEEIYRHHAEQIRRVLGELKDDKVRWLSFCNFWVGLDQRTKDRISSEKIDVIMSVVVKELFVVKEVTSTLVMDSLYSGLRAFKLESKSKQENSSFLKTVETPAPFIVVVDDMFVLADDFLKLLDCISLEPLPDKDHHDRIKGGNDGLDYSMIETPLTDLGSKMIENFVLSHIFSKKIQATYAEAITLKRQEELIREEEALGKAETELKAKCRVSGKKKRSKKKSV